jgi:hypothetical protein
MSLIIALIPLAIALVGAMTNRKQNAHAQNQGFSVATGITDVVLLKQAFALLDCEVNEIQGHLLARLGETDFELVRNENDSFDAVFPPNITEEESEAFVRSVLSEYGKLVQQQVYQKVKTRAKNQGWTIENETVQDDNSIKLTLQV